MPVRRGGQRFEQATQRDLGAAGVQPGDDVADLHAGTPTRGDANHRATASSRFSSACRASMKLMTRMIVGLSSRLCEKKLAITSCNTSTRCSPDVARHNTTSK